ncbi:MAG: MIP/aquaporin family protein [Bacteroidales bacterium]
MSQFLAELIGTAILVLFGDGVVAGVVLKGTKSEHAGWIVITVGWGLGVALAIYGVGSISGAHLNPAVTLALAAQGAFPWENVPNYILAQMLGGIVGGTVVWMHYLPHWKNTESQTTKLAVFCTVPAIRSQWANLLSEIIGTFVLITGLLFIGANKFTEGLNPLIVGFLIIAIGVSMGGTTGYAINPARDLGPRIAHFLLPIAGKGNSDWGYSWIPVVGPVLGGVYGALVYDLIMKHNARWPFWILSGLILLVVVAAVYRQLKEDQKKL